VSAGLYAFEVDQGATYVRGVVPATSAGTLNLSGYSARLMVRESKTSAGTVLSLTSPSGGLVLSSGTVTATISAAQSGSILAGGYVYDLEIESSGGAITRIIEGPFTVSGEVTR